MKPYLLKKRENLVKIEALQHSNLQVREIHCNKIFKMVMLNIFKIVLREQVK